MNVEVRNPARVQEARPGIVDCDIHPKSSLDDLRPFLSNRWWDYLQTYGRRSRHGYVAGYLSQDDADRGAPRRLAARRQ
jgi:hypothetical protein